MELKKPHPSIQNGKKDRDTERAGPTPTCGGQKFRRDISGARSPRPTPGPPAQDSSARKISASNFWLQKPVDIELGEESAGAPHSSL